MNIDGSIGSKYQLPITTRPYDFGTDAIERQRVSLGVSLIDADFEYGLQATKWQTYADFRKTPSFYEIPGSDVSAITSVTASSSTITVVTNITPVVATTTSGSATGSTTSITLVLSAYTSVAVGQIVIVTGINGLAVVTNVNGTTNITVTYPTQTAPTIGNGVTISFYSSVVPNVGSIVNVSGLANSANDANRAEGFFIVTAVSAPNPAAFQYGTKGGTVTNGTISTSYTTIRRGGVFNNGACKIQNIGSVVGSDTYVTVTMLSNKDHGLVAGTPITVFGYDGTNINGNYIVQSITNNVTFTYATPSGTTTGARSGGSIYIQPYAYSIHRPFDGGVIISPNIPTHGATIIRQSKKVFRYQSGKGLLWSSGTLFCPNNDIVSLTYSSGLITITTSIPHGAPQSGASIQVKGVTSSGYNGTYTIASIVGDTVLRVANTSPITDSTAILGDQPRFTIPNWHGSSVRAGCFDDQNGMFWEYDGQTLWVVRRSSTFQLAGTISVAQNSSNISGTGTRFTSQLKVNDRVVIRGMTYQVTRCTVDTNLYINPPYRGSADSLGVIMCKVKETRIPQNQFNRDTIDGLGPSGYKVDLTKMQMIGLQYTWYGAGFIDFMIRGSDGNWVYAHRFRNNNVNDEAYMRTGNMPVRYEICNESVAASTTLGADISTTGALNSITLSDSTTYWPTSGTVLIEQELLSYTGKSGNTLTGIGRAASLAYNIADTPYTFTGAVAATHTMPTSVNLVSCTCSPSLTHWGSALLMDGNFDSDRGYFFNYQVNSVASVSAGTTINLFMLRLSPAVSNGIIGDIGTRDLLNRAQLLLQRLDVFGGSGTAGNGSSGSIVISGILNPSGLSVSSWSAINSAANGSQPSFTQVSTSFSGYYIAGSGERIFSTISNNGQNSIDLSNLKEVCNGVIGGNQMFPDGPDTLLVQLTVPTGFPALSSYSVNLFWTEAQA
jgi:hypothetical protein